MTRRWTAGEARAFCDAAAIKHGVTVDVITGRSRTFSAVRARWAVMHQMEAAGWPYVSIGRALGRDHTTVLHACGRLSRSLAA